MLAAYIVLTIFVVTGIILLTGKGSWLIAGYNTANKEDKEKYNEKKLCRSMGIMFLLISVIIVAMCIINTDEFAIAMIIPIIVIIVLGIIYINKFCYKKDWEKDKK